MAGTATPNMRMALPAEGNHPPLGLAPHDVRMAPAADGIPNILPPAAVQGGGRAPQVQPVAQMNAPPGMTLPPEQKPRTFREFYNDTRKDPCRGDYSGVMQRFDPEAATVVASEILLEQALGCRADMHQAYLCCAGLPLLCSNSPRKSHFLRTSSLSLCEFLRRSYHSMGQQHVRLPRRCH
jgi:hypothetical protein